MGLIMFSICISFSLEELNEVKMLSGLSEFSDVYETSFLDLNLMWHNRVISKSDFSSLNVQKS